MEPHTWGGSGAASPTSRRSQEEQHRSHENCLDAAADGLLDLQRNLPGRRGRSRELEEYRLRKDYLEYEVRRVRVARAASAAPSWPPRPLQPSLSSRPARFGTWWGPKHKGVPASLVLSCGRKAAACLDHFFFFYRGRYFYNFSSPEGIFDFV